MSKMETESRKRVPPEAKVIGRNLRDLRRERKMSRREIAKILGVSLQQIQKYEVGENRFPLDKLHKLKGVFGVSYDIFFKGLDNAKHEKILSMDSKSIKVQSACDALENMKRKKFQNKICEAVLILTA